MDRIAHSALRLLTELNARPELLKDEKLAGLMNELDLMICEAKAKETTTNMYREAALGHSSEGQLELDDGAVVSMSDGGAYVQMWRWIDDDEAFEALVQYCEERSYNGDCPATRKIQSLLDAMDQTEREDHLLQEALEMDTRGKLQVLLEELEESLPAFCEMIIEDENQSDSASEILKSTTKPTV